MTRLPAGSCRSSLLRAHIPLGMSNFSTLYHFEAAVAQAYQAYEDLRKALK